MFLNKLVALSIAVDTISIVFTKSKKVETTINCERTQCENIDDSYYDDEDDWDDYVEMMNDIFGYNFLY